MKRLALLALAVTPSSAMAHGVHAPVAESAHDTAHAVVILAIVALLGGVAVLRWGRDRS